MLLGGLRKMQKQYWIVEIEGLDWTKERKIWNTESAVSTYSIERYWAKAQGRDINIYFIDENGTKLKVSNALERQELII